MTKIDTSRFIADMIKVHGGECPKVWQDALAMQGLTVVNGEIVAIKPNAVADGKPAIVDENGLHVLKQDALTEFEQMLKSGTNIYVEQGRRMEDWDAKADAKDLLEIARIQDDVSGIILDREEGENNISYLERCLVPKMRTVWYEAAKEIREKEQKKYEAELELAYKNADDVQRRNGFLEAIDVAYKWLYNRYDRQGYLDINDLDNCREALNKKK